jgi:hypothetical protein
MESFDERTEEQTALHGLVHGCGFASALSDLGIGSNGTNIVVPLVSFNLGVEMCQMTIAALVLPLIWKLRERPQFVQRFVPAATNRALMPPIWPSGDKKSPCHKPLENTLLPCLCRQVEDKASSWRI